MDVELVAEVAHHILADNIIQIWLRNADQAGNYRHYTHNCNQNNQQLHIPFADGVVKDKADHKGVYQPQHRGKKDCEQDQENLAFIGCEGLGHAPECAGVGFASAPLLFFEIGSHIAAAHTMHHKSYTPEVDLMSLLKRKGWVMLYLFSLQMKYTGLRAEMHWLSDRLRTCPF